MRAVVCQHAELEVVELPEPDPGARPGAPARCCAAGSAARTCTPATASTSGPSMAVRAGYDRFGRSDQPIVFGHEFSRRGRRVRAGLRGDAADRHAGRRAAARCATPHGIDTVGLSAHAPGAYAEQLLVAGVADDAGAQRARARRRGAHRADGRRLARRAPRRGRQARRGDRHRLRPGRPRRDPDAEGQGRAHRRGQRLLARPPRAGDRVRRRRRRRPGGRLALRAAATSAATSPTCPRRSSWRSARARSSSACPVGWWHALARWARSSAASPKHPVIFECVGVPGVIESIIDGAPLFSRVVVVGVCVGPDRFTPAMAINKEIDLRFVFGLHAAGVPRHPAHARRGQGRPAPADHRHRRPRRRRRGVHRARRPRDATRRS